MDILQQKSILLLILNSDLTNVLYFIWQPYQYGKIPAESILFNESSWSSH